MGNVLVGGIYVVQATKDDTIEYWAAATSSTDVWPPECGRN
jgi:hypothetical protein